VLGAAAVSGRGARAEGAPAAFEVVPIAAQGKHASRASLLVPRHLPEGRSVRLVVALHGLGESHDPALGVRAWLDLYGLRTAYTRLLSPPVERTHKRRDWTDDRLAEVNRSLAKDPFGGLAVVCPFTPNFKQVPNRAEAVREYGDWIVERLLPRARALAPVLSEADATAIDGCSMGGPIAVDVFTEHPTAFGALGVVQGALGAHRAGAWADAIAKAKGDRRLRIHLLSSEGDPFRDPTLALARELTKRKVEHTLRVPPGPHDQPWLRETGTIEMLLFHERG
jgi:fermentation-respiration switch protein FrsA (DUF1100 family)